MMQLMDLHDTWYEHGATRGHTTFLRCTSMTEDCSNTIDRKYVSFVGYFYVKQQHGVCAMNLFSFRSDGENW
jgi:hypothetical protein